MPIEGGDMIIVLKDKSEWTSASSFPELADKMTKTVKRIAPGVTTGFQFPVQIRFNELMTGAKQDLVCKIYGEDLQKLSEYAEKLGSISKTVQGAADLYVEKVTGMSLQDYATQQFYAPLEMQSTGFLPLTKTTIDNIAASEVDNYYRHELIQGAVHDEGASVMGGIAGHAGLFSNASDLAKLYLMLLNKGSWNGKNYFNQSTVDLFTAYNTDNSRRGLGFDKPEKNNATAADPYPCLSASPSTFGHTGFTGTCVWADPEKDLLFIFLSNRVYPTRNNKAFSESNIRAKIQDALYASLN